MPGDLDRRIKFQASVLLRLASAAVDPSVVEASWIASATFKQNETASAILRKSACLAKADHVRLYLPFFFCPPATDPHISSHIHPSADTQFAVFEVRRS